MTRSEKMKIVWKRWKEEKPQWLHNRNAKISERLKGKPWHGTHVDQTGIKRPEHATLMKKYYLEGRWKCPMKDPKIREKTRGFRGQNPKLSETWNNKYASGYINPKKGKKVSDSTRKKMSDVHRGVQLSDSHKNKLSNLFSGKNNPFYGKKHNLETRKLMCFKRLSRIFPSKDTSIEIKLQTALKQVDIEYEKHAVIENFVQSDILIKPNIVIFVDGCYWHSCPIHYPDRIKLSGVQNKQLIRDTVVNQFFNNLNGKYIVLRFWEHEINSDIRNIVSKIEDKIDKSAVAVSFRLI